MSTYKYPQPHWMTELALTAVQMNGSGFLPNCGHLNCCLKCPNVLCYYSTKTHGFCVCSFQAWQDVSDIVGSLKASFVRQMHVILVLVSASSMISVSSQECFHF